MTRYAITTLALLVAAAVSSACERCAAPLWAPPTATATKAEENADPKEAERIEKRKQHKAAAEKVFAHLLTHSKPVKGMTWPPAFKVVPKAHGQVYNAVAECVWKNGKHVLKDGKYQPVVTITYGYLELLGGDENGIALILGHELGHHALGHTTVEVVEKPTPLKAIESHRVEADADRFGAKLALIAGYSVRRAVKAKWQGLERLGGNAPAAGATCVSHPGNSDRAARVLAALDDPAAGRWRTMAAFENGAAFLAVDDYEAAEAAFAAVAAEFPNCYEAWANLGVARLMRYCDGLSAETIKRLGLGQFVGSAHFPTAPSLLRGAQSDLWIASSMKTGAAASWSLRGAQNDLWIAAVADLKRADKLKPGSPVVLANLGLAHLVHPAGKEKGLEDAARYFDAAAAALAKAELPPQLEVTIRVNIGVARLAAGEAAKGRKLLDEAEELAEKEYGDPKEFAWPATLTAALRFNRAALETNDKPAAGGRYKQYLAQTPQSCPWWAVTYERYQALCQDTGREPKPETDLAKSAPRREQLVVALRTGGTVHVGQQVADALAALGEPTSEALHPVSSVRVLRFEKHGVELIADEDEVFAVVIVSAKGPVVPVREAGPNGKKLGELKVGMTRAEVEAMSGGKRFVARPYSDPAVKYAYYEDMGVAVKYDKDGVVVAIIVGKFTKK